MIVLLHWSKKGLMFKFNFHLREKCMPCHIVIWSASNVSDSLSRTFTVQLHSRVCIQKHHEWHMFKKFLKTVVLKYFECKELWRSIIKDLWSFWNWPARFIRIFLRMSLKIPNPFFECELAQKYVTKKFCVTFWTILLISLQFRILEMEIAFETV
jgi:hypothetical protein